MRKLALPAVLALAFVGVSAAPAAAAPSVSLCGKVSVTVNGTNLVDQATCQVLPPA